MTVRLGAAAALVLLVASLVLGAAGPAQAHAFLIGSDPAEGAVLETAPERIELTFSESVSAVPDGVAVFDATGGPVATTAVTTDETLELTLDEEVEDGTLVVVWRVVSADGHPVGGSLTFSVGAVSAEVAAVPEAAAVAEDGVARAPWLLGPLRWVGYTGLLLTAGLVAFVVLFLPAGPDAGRARRRLVSVVRVGAGLAAVAWLLTLPVVAAYQVGGGVGSLTRASTWSSLPPSEYGVAVVVGLGVLAAAVLLGGGAPARARARLALGAGALGVAAPALTGHTRAASPEVLVVAADVLHLAAGGIWLGGLVGLALTLPDLAGRGDLAASTLARFSTVAAGVLAALVVTGSLLAWRIVGSWTALTGTGFGQLLLAKVALAVVAVAIASWNRLRLLPRLQGASRRRDRRAGATPVVRATLAEAAVLVGLLSLTGVLVDRSPDPAAASAAADEALDPALVGPHLASLGDLEVQAGVSPHAAGPNDLTIQVRDAAGVPTEGVEEPRVRLATDGLDLGTVELDRIGPGTYTADVVLPRPGTWELVVSLRTGEFDNPVATLEFGVA